jgi:hypothetical protein
MCRGGAASQGERPVRAGGVAVADRHRRLTMGGHQLAESNPRAVVHVRLAPHGQPGGREWPARRRMRNAAVAERHGELPLRPHVRSHREGGQPARHRVHAARPRVEAHVRVVPAVGAPADAAVYRAGAEGGAERIPHGPRSIAAERNDADAEVAERHEPASAVHAEAVTLRRAGPQLEEDVRLGGGGRRSEDGGSEDHERQTSGQTVHFHQVSMGKVGMRLAPRCALRSTHRAIFS